MPTVHYNVHSSVTLGNDKVSLESFAKSRNKIAVYREKSGFKSLDCKRKNRTKRKERCKMVETTYTLI